MAHGLPVITTENCVAGMELVSEDTGTIIPTENVEAIVSSIHNFYNTNCYSSKKVLEKANEYTIERMAEVHMEIFNNYEGEFKLK